MLNDNEKLGAEEEELLSKHSTEPVAKLPADFFKRITLPPLPHKGYRPLVIKTVVIVIVLTLAFLAGVLFAQSR